MMYLGIDPGRTAGWVCLEAVGMYGSTGDTLRYVDRGTISVRQRKALDTVDKRDQDYCQQWFAVRDHIEPDTVVVERPEDGKPFWGKKRHTATATAFRLGCYYAYAIAGTVYPNEVGWHSYTVKEWMQGRPRTTTDILIANASRHVTGCPNDWGNHEHELMALGVLLHHLGRLIPTEAR